MRWFPLVRGVVQRHPGSKEIAFLARIVCWEMEFLQVLVAVATACVASVSFYKNIFTIKSPKLQLVYSSSDLWRCDKRKFDLFCESQPSGCVRWHWKLSGYYSKAASRYLPIAFGSGHVFHSPTRGGKSFVQPGSVADFGRQSHTHYLWQFHWRSQ